MSVLKLKNAPATMRKISLNVINQNADETRFTIPFEGIPFQRAELNAYMGDRTFESLYDRKPDGLWVPMDWIKRLPKAELALDDEFETDGAEIVVSGERALVFERDEESGEEEEDDDKAPAVRVTNLVLAPKLGGVTLLSLHLQIKPGLGKENLALQQHQFRQVKLTLGDLKLAERKASKQQDLPLGGERAQPQNGAASAAAGESPPSGEPPVSTADHSAPAFAGGPRGDSKAFEAGAKRSLEAHKRRGAPIDGRTAKSRRESSRSPKH